MYKIRLENVNFRYSPGTVFEMQALKNINIGFEENKITGLIGHTGSGKSTLVQMLNGLMKPETGKVFLGEKDIWEKPKELAKIRFAVGLVMQYPEYQLFEETVRKDVAFGPKNMGLSDDETDLRITDAVKTVGLAPEVLDKSPFDLSGGQKRRVAIAGIMAMEPEVLVLDEPAAGLDPEGKEEIFSAIERYRREKNATVIIVSHSMEDMARWCDDIVVMSRSEILMHGTRDEVFSRAAELEKVGLAIPQITQLMILLKKRGINVDDGIYTVDAAFDALKKIFNESRNNR